MVTTLLVPTNHRGTSVVVSWCRWHLGVGFDHLFLFFDTGTDSNANDTAARGAGDEKKKNFDPTLPPVDGAGLVPNHPAARAVNALFGSRVTVVAGQGLELRQWQQLHCPSWATHAPFVDSEVPSRQCLNAETALTLCRRRGLTWLLHLDIDELFYTGPAQASGPTVGGQAEIQGPREVGDTGTDDGRGVGGAQKEPSTEDGLGLCLAGLPQVGLHFAELEAEGCESLCYANHEGFPESEDPGSGDYFRGVCGATRWGQCGTFVPFLCGKPRFRTTWGGLH